MSDSHLPIHWEFRSVNDVVTDTAGGFGFPKNFQGRRDLPFPFVKVSDMNLPGNETYITTAENFVDDMILDEIRAKTYPPSTIVFPKIGGAIATNKKRILGVEATFDNNVMAIVPNEQKALTKWIFYYLQSIDLMKLANSGPVPSIRQSTVQALTIPIPYPHDPARSLDTQRRIVARIEALLSEVRDMRALNAKLMADAENLYRAIVFNRSEWTPTYIPIQEFVSRIFPNVDVEDNEEYSFAGVKSFGRGVFPGKRILGSETSYRQLTRIRTGHFIYPKLMAWEGALGMVPPECDGYVVSPEYPVFEVDESKVLPEVLDVYFRTPSVWPRLAELSTGTNARRRRLNPEVLLTYEVPIPPMSVQIQLRKAKNEFGNLREIKETDQLLNTLEASILNQAFRGEL